MRRRPAALAERRDEPLDVVRPFAWIAAIAFAIGFWGYMAALPLMG